MRARDYWTDPPSTELDSTRAGDEAGGGGPIGEESGRVETCETTGSPFEPLEDCRAAHVSAGKDRPSSGSGGQRASGRKRKGADGKVNVGRPVVKRPWQEGTVEGPQWRAGRPRAVAEETLARGEEWEAAVPEEMVCEPAVSGRVGVARC